MKKRLRGVYFFVSSIIIALLHFPFASAKNASGIKLSKVTTNDSAHKITIDVAPASPPVTSVYDSLHLEMMGLSRLAYEFARKGLKRLINQGKIVSQSVISVIDFSLPGNKKRLFVIDLNNYSILFNTYVAHGRNTGRERAYSFSNQHSSYKSSPGFYITKETYHGKHGLSLKLEGLERGINDNAYDRGIVIHGAHYVSESIANTQGYVGRSEGCPAVPEQLSTPIINAIKNGTCVFIYHPSYINRSAILD
ncbi:MAG: murein L,D-transpeptidase catalytic domain family protein [Chitinophagaceae bacterium]|nr:murein L,D-transpeptidase catalytic domain family protein [Chitinophagaceae bacterium]MBK8952122.1 murein L,D-transpeptidase catalytic domain family protein [Chitinophagaceae bacterium]